MILAVVLEKVVLLSTGSSLLRIYGGPDTHADPILVGCLFGVLFATGRAPKVGRFGGPLALTAVVGAVVTAEWVPTLRATHATSILRIAFALACAFLILGAMDGRIVSRALSIRPLTFLGRISYSLYLWHVPIVAAASTTAMDGRVRSVVAACSAVAVAAASFYLFEQPLSQRWRHPRAPAVLAPAVQAEAA
jgi:peptidoglycan/LPS O-acetylase OafA/YrhL